jgi:hypothetical protein
VAPVALIILLFIFFFNYQTVKKLFGCFNKIPQSVEDSNKSSHKDFNNKHFLLICLLLFFYYLIAIVFFGQYQERYRMPLMVVFVIPLLSYFIAKFRKEQFLKRISLYSRFVIILLFMTVWLFQAKNSISNKDRFNNAIESVKESTKRIQEMKSN